jgi:hypothetical protein
MQERRGYRSRPCGHLHLVLSEHVGAAGEKRRIHARKHESECNAAEAAPDAAFSAVLAANRNAASDLLHPAVGEEQVAWICDLSDLLLP